MSIAKIWVEVLDLLDVMSRQGADWLGSKQDTDDSPPHLCSDDVATALFESVCDHFLGGIPLVWGSFGPQPRYRTVSR